MSKPKAPTQSYLGNWEHNECPGNRRHRTLLDAVKCQRDLAFAALDMLVDLKDGPRDESYQAAKDAAWEEARRILSNDPNYVGGSAPRSKSEPPSVGASRPSYFAAMDAEARLRNAAARIESSDGRLTSDGSADLDLAQDDFVEAFDAVLAAHDAIGVPREDLRDVLDQARSVGSTMPYHRIASILEGRSTWRDNHRPNQPIG